MKTILFSIITFATLVLCIPASAREITVISDSNYPPYSFRDENGNPSGITIDQWKLWEKKTGIKVKFNLVEWSDALAAFNRGEADVIDTIFKTAERQNNYDFTDVYAKIDVPIFVKDNIIGIHDPAALKGFVVGVKKSDACIGVLKSFGIDQFREYQSYEELIRGAVTGEVKIFCVDKPPALYYLYRNNHEDSFRIAFSLYEGGFCRAVRKGDSATMQLVRNGFSRITASEFLLIESAWTGQTISLPVGVTHAVPIFSAMGTIILIISGLLVVLYRRNRRSTAELKEIKRISAERETVRNAFFSVLPDTMFSISRDGTLGDIRTPASIARFIPAEWNGNKIGKDAFDDEFSRNAFIAMEKVLTEGDIGTLVFSLLRNNEKRTFDARIARSGSNETIWVCRDMTDLLKREEELIRAQKMETIGNLAGGLSHDFNNILGAILGTASLLRHEVEIGDAPREQVMSDISMIEDTAKRGAEIVSQLLALSRRTSSDYTVVDLLASIRHVLKICRSTFDRSVEIKFIEPGFKPCIHGDRSQIDQVMLNLCINGYQAMTTLRRAGEEIGGVLSILVERIIADDSFLSTHPRAEALNYWCITISDTGIGIDAGTMSRIFEPFYTTWSTGGGTGLGLTIAYKIVEQHKGFIDVFSEKGTGSTFKIFIPEIAAGSHESESHLDGDTVYRGEGLVLVVDDEDIILDSAKRMLEFSGYRVISARNGDDAIRIYEERTENFVCVLLDMSMPGMSGRELFEYFNRIDPSMSISTLR